VIAGFRPVNLAIVPVALVFMILIAAVFAALGVAIGSSLQDMQGFQLIMNFLVMPIFFLSGALFPLSGLPKALTWATSADPLSYGIDGMRSVLLGISHYGAVLDVEVLAVVAAVLMVFGAHRFSKIEI
jgi:ABC-2 type transport system permease protein